MTRLFSAFLLAGLARRGHAVEVLIATDGKYGSRLPGVVEGEELGILRRKESECAAARLGIPSPKFLAIDRLDTRNGVRQYLDGRKVLLAALERHLAEIDRMHC
jgi:LmbE family N-acetylglucosaminyl deacetylase